jgi:transposase
VVVNQARSLLAELEPDDVAAVERHRQAGELVDEIERLDDTMRDSRARITAAVTASQTTLREVFGVGPIVACMLIGYSGDPNRFTTASRYAAYTGCAPVEFSSRPGHPPVVTARQPATQPCVAHRRDRSDP